MWPTQLLESNHMNNDLDIHLKKQKCFSTFILDVEISPTIKKLNLKYDMIRRAQNEKKNTKNVNYKQ